MPIQRVAPLALALFAAVASAASADTVVYRWVDESGRTHLSDVVPDRYRARARRVETREYEIPAERAFLAQKALARQKAELEDRLRRGRIEPAPPSPAVAPGQIRAAAGETRDCDALRRAYRESQECFAPYHNANGSVRAEAFARCTPVEDPSFQCGVPTGSE